MELDYANEAARLRAKAEELTPALDALGLAKKRAERDYLAAEARFELVADERHALLAAAGYLDNVALRKARDAEDDTD